MREREREGERERERAQQYERESNSMREREREQQYEREREREIYHVGLLNAVERSVPLHGSSDFWWLIIFLLVAVHIMTAVRESHVSRITPQVVR